MQFWHYLQSFFQLSFNLFHLSPFLILEYCLVFVQSAILQFLSETLKKKKLFLLACHYYFRNTEHVLPPKTEEKKPIKIHLSSC